MNQKWVFITCLLSLLIQPIISEEWERVYLASFPRSGNTWTRCLIEEATHIATSSVGNYMGEPHEKLPMFPWFGYCLVNGITRTATLPTIENPIIVKTHYPSSAASKGDLCPAKANIWLIRHPIDSIYSYFVYKNPSKNNQIIPTRTVKEMISSWKKFYSYWKNQSNTILIRYEDLYENPYKYLKIILETSGYIVLNEDIERAIAKYPPKGGLLKHLSQYKKKDIDLVTNELYDYLVEQNYQTDFTNAPI